MPKKVSNLSSKMLWSTVSNAKHKSNNTNAEDVSKGSFTN